ncbi:MAG: hypothetical protein K5669_12850 [Lachnospiraceae bacterium]|nr:hypothetical protein [Lachnospiraceae bacterium]
MVSVNKKYKDRLFCLLFGSEEYKENTLSLYNSLNGTNYSDVDGIDIYTIDDVIYIQMKNDVAFIMDSYLNLWEQQSTINPNMPIRGLMYFGKMYSKYIEEHKLNIYGKTRVSFPAPNYIVFYNGTDKLEPVTKLKLSDSFMHSISNGEFEWTATVYNLNYNNDLLLKCRVLSDYMELIKRIRNYCSLENDFRKAVDEAVEDCIRDGILSDFLSLHRAEVIDVCLTEYNEEVFVKGIREESYEEGLEQGREQGREQGIDIGQANACFSLVKKGLITQNDAAAELKLSMQEFEKAFNLWNKKTV